MKTFPSNFALEVDAYQASHSFTIPTGMQDFQCSQAVFRKPLDSIPNTIAGITLTRPDHRIVSAGLQAFVKLELERKFTMEDFEEASDLYSDFHAHFEPPYSKPYLWPRGIFKRVVDEFDGRLPIVVTGLADGTAHYVGEPCVQVWTNVEGMGELVGWVESSMLPYLWAMATVATRGRRRKEKFHEIFSKAYPSCSHDEREAMIQTRYHDFGRRGGANSQMTGIAHLMNWNGTDTMDAVHASVKYLNDGYKFGACSINASAHRSITPWDTEEEAYKAHIDHGADGIFAIVADSYDYFEGVQKLCAHADEIKERGGVLVVRPDSGDPMDCVLYALRELAVAFGTTENETGLKVLNNCGVIQGDGVDDAKIFEILAEVVRMGFSPVNVAFGMGEHNHKAQRSEMELAYKTCLVGTAGGGFKPTMKASNSSFKRSFPCAVSVEDILGERVHLITPEEMMEGKTGQLIVHYNGIPDCPLEVDEYYFDHTRELTTHTWNGLDPTYEQEADTISTAIRELQDSVMESYLNEKVGA